MSTTVGVRDLILALLTAGGTTFVWTVVRSIIALRASAESREERAVARLEKFEANCREQLALERVWGAYWNRRASMLEHLLLVNGLQVPENEPEPERGR